MRPKVVRVGVWFVALAIPAFVFAQDESKPPPPPNAGAKADSPPKTPDGAGRVLARVNGREITIDDYVGYLLASLGKSKLGEYVDRLLIDEEARGQSVSFTPKEIEAGVDELVTRTVKSLYGGDQERFAESLKRRRMTLEDYKARVRQDLYYDKLYGAVIMKKRVVDDRALRREFETIYGKDGVQFTLRHVLVATRAGVGIDVTRTETEAKERAAKALREVQGGKSFVDAVKEYSDDVYTRTREGRIPHYRRGLYGDVFDIAVTRLSKENPLSGVVASPHGHHVIQLVEKRVTRFDDVKKGLEAAVKSKLPSKEEKNALIAELRKEAKIEGL